MDIDVDERGKLVLRPQPERLSLEELVAQITDENRHEAHWNDESIGRELW